MTDDIDRACEREIQDRERALQAQAAKPVMQPCGSCYNCDVAVSGRCFCDGDCRDDYERRTRAKKLNR